MTKFSRTWWGEIFIKALESFTDSGRLQRGRSYAGGGKVKSFEINGNHITAKVRGSVNPYFGVHKEPTYDISIQITPIPKTLKIHFPNSDYTSYQRVVRISKQNVLVPILLTLVNT
jgi:uncharacterized Zn finger protein